MAPQDLMNGRPTHFGHLVLWSLKQNYNQPPLADVRTLKGLGIMMKDHPKESQLWVVTFSEIAKEISRKYDLVIRQGLAGYEHLPTAAKQCSICCR